MYDKRADMIAQKVFQMRTLAAKDKVQVVEVLGAEDVAVAPVAVGVAVHDGGGGGRKHDHVQAVGHMALADQAPLHLHEHKPVVRRFLGVVMSARHNGARAQAPLLLHEHKPYNMKTQEVSVGHTALAPQAPLHLHEQKPHNLQAQGSSCNRVYGACDPGPES